jgi:HEPN domain-containing protein
LPSPEQVEYAELLLRKAESDLATVRALADSGEVGDEVIGFHAQQAVEKSVKSVLVVDGVEVPRTHDLDYLAELVRGSDREFPDAVHDASWLSPWATQFRYDDPFEALDRASALEAANAAVRWARSVIAPARQ